MDDKLLLLGILRRQEMHGYQLFELIDRDLATCTSLKKPTAYYLLNRMAQDGWICEEQTQEGNRPPRKVYHLTPEGEIAFQKLLRENLSSYTTVSFPGDTGLAFLEALDPSEALGLLRQRQAALVQALLQAQAAPRHRGSLQWVIDHQIQHLQAERAWLEQIIAQFEIVSQE